MYFRKIVLDFDGTIFRLFTNYSLDKAISKIAGRMKCYDIDFPLNSDIFDSFYYATNANLNLSRRQELLLEINDIVVKAEIEALNSGILIDGFYDFLDYVEKENIPVGIASNNSKECIKEFLKKYCNDLALPIIGRDPLHPELMKPHPMILNKICNKLMCNNKDIIFVGDNIRDYQCALSFSVDFIALASTPPKYERLVKNGLDITKINIVKNFYELLDIIKNK